MFWPETSETGLAWPGLASRLTDIGRLMPCENNDKHEPHQSISTLTRLVAWSVINLDTSRAGVI